MVFGAIGRFLGGGSKIKEIEADYEALAKYLDGGGLMDRVSELILTQEKRETYDQAAAVSKMFIDEYRDFDKAGGLNQASLAASRSDIFRTGAAAGLGRGRYSATELAQGMSQMRFAGMAQAEQTRAALRSAIGMGQQYQLAAAGQMDLAPTIQSILSSAAGLEGQRLGANAQIRMANAQMDAALGGAVLSAFAPIGAAGVMSGFGFGSMGFNDALSLVYGGN